MLFGLFNKKTDKTKNAIEIASNILHPQLNHKGTTTQFLMSDEFTLGYIDGVLFSILSALEIGDNNVLQGFNIYEVCKNNLFGNNGKERENLSTYKISKGLPYQDGSLAGQRDTKAYLRDKSLPIRLRTYLNK